MSARIESGTSTLSTVNPPWTPRCALTTPALVSTLSASPMTGLLTPMVFASASTLGSRSPESNAPERMAKVICSTTSSCARGLEIG